jgi:hypothetical protein
MAGAVVVLGLFDPFPLQSNATLYRLENGVPKRLEPGATLHPKDELAMQFEGSQDAHVYVFNEAERKLGKLYTLFPLPYGDLHNPLHGDRKHFLPGNQRGRKISWALDTTGGTERILVIASRKPLPRFERLAELAALDAADEGLDVAPGASETLRGIHPVPPPATSKLDELVRELGAPNNGLWWQVIDVQSKSWSD